VDSICGKWDWSVEKKGLVNEMKLRGKMMKVGWDMERGCRWSLKMLSAFYRWVTQLGLNIYEWIWNEGLVGDDLVGRRVVRDAKKMGGGALKFEGGGRYSGKYICVYLMRSCSEGKCRGKNVKRIILDAWKKN
jgi:hypothetical protein